MLTDLHKFKEVDPTCVPMPPLQDAKLPPSMFKATPKQNSMDMKDVVGGAASWVTRKANQQHLAAVELLATRVLHRLGKLEALADSWRYVLFVPGMLVHTGS